MSQDDETSTTQRLFQEASSAFSQAANDTMRGLRSALTFENLGYTVGQVAMVEATRTASKAVASKVEKAFRPEPCKVHSARRAHLHRGRGFCCTCP